MGISLTRSCLTSCLPEKQSFGVSLQSSRGIRCDQWRETVRKTHCSGWKKRKQSTVCCFPAPCPVSGSARRCALCRAERTLCSGTPGSAGRCTLPTAKRGHGRSARLALRHRPIPSRRPAQPRATGDGEPAPALAGSRCPAPQSAVEGAGRKDGVATSLPPGICPRPSRCMADVGRSSPPTSDRLLSGSSLEVKDTPEPNQVMR